MFARRGGARPDPATHSHAAKDGGVPGGGVPAPGLAWQHLNAKRELAIRAANHQSPDELPRGGVERVCKEPRLDVLPLLHVRILKVRVEQREEWRVRPRLAAVGHALRCTELRGVRLF